MRIIGVIIELLSLLEALIYAYIVISLFVSIMCYNCEFCKILNVNNDYILLFCSFRCVALKEYMTTDLDKYHCPRCEAMCGPSLSKTIACHYILSIV